MNNPTHKLIRFLWIIIALLVLAGGAAGYLMYRHGNDLEQANTYLRGDNLSLRSQLRQAKATPTPTPTPEATPLPTPTPKPAATPKATVKPKS